MDNRQLLLFKKWFQTRSHHQRVFFLLLGFVVIYLLWYSLLTRPIHKYKVVALNQIALMQAHIVAYNQKAAAILEDVKKQAVNTKKIASAPKNISREPLPKDNEPLIKAMLSVHPNVLFSSLKTIPATTATAAPTDPVRDGLQVSFQSNYFDTINYLTQLENLPWCLSWDSLEYKVMKYPDAMVTVTLHMVNA